MASAANVEATAVNTMAWLAAEDTAIVVPVYQRQYRWDIGACEQLLADVLAISTAEESQRHFLGSILSSRSQTDAQTELVLIDGQQRITTLMLLVAALQHTAAPSDPALADRLAGILELPGEAGRTKLRPHREWADVFRTVVLTPPEPGSPLRESRFDDNYAFFRSQIDAHDTDRIWRGLQRLEHVAISLGADANAQQTFESLNSTGAPLRDHELIHNYVLMGLGHAQQREVEEDFWLPIERATGDEIGAFWRDYLVMRTGREVVVAGGRGVYDVFRQEFPRLDLASLRQVAGEWREYAEVYRNLLEPGHEADSELARQFRWVGTFGRSMYPLLMWLVHDLQHDRADRSTVLDLFEQVQALLLRREIVGLSTERLVARLCRARHEGDDALAHAMARIMPSDERIRMATKFIALPRPAYVLGRLAGVDPQAGFGVEHIAPVAPSDSWTGDGVRTWSEYSDDEQNSHRALADTLGNLTLLEDDLALAGLDLSFPAKRDRIFARSEIDLTADLLGTTAWSTTNLTARTAALTERVLKLWQRPLVTEIDDDGLTPILDAKLRRGWPRGWDREFSYTEFRGERWEVADVKHLFNRVFKRLWADYRQDVQAFTARRGGPVYEAMAWNGHWDALDETHFLYMGWDSRYMLSAVQGVLDQTDLASEVFVKYSYIGDVM